MAQTKTLGVGPFTGVRTTLNPYDDAGSDTLASATNCYFQDPVVGGGVFQRPGSTNPVNAPGITYGGMYSHTAGNGSVYNFVVNGDGITYQKLYRWQSMGASLVDVTPANMLLPLTARVYFNSLADEMIVSDGNQKAWRVTNLGGTPVTATPIEYGVATNVLSIGSTDTALANSAFVYTTRVVSGFGTQTTKAANPIGTAIGALGTLPANQWVSILVELDTATGNFVFAAAAGIAVGYATEPLAIAALPARTANRWYVGYVTVRADAALAWIAGTDAFAGGATGNQAQTTNYYAGEGPAWSAFQQPVIYSGSLFFVLNQVNGTYARTAITWSEPNLPAEGYQQSGYDNVWELTQTSALPIYALAATNDVLYYFREASIGAVSGTPGINFQGTATHDVVAGNIGCVESGSIAQYLNYVYFADQNGRPHRLPIGGAPEPIWTQAYSLYETAQGYTGVAANAGVIEPNLNVYLVLYTNPNTTRTMTVWDAQTGRYQGTWTFDGSVPFVLAILRDSAAVTSGGLSLGMMMNVIADTPLYKLATVFDNVWADAGIATSVGVHTGFLGYDAKQDRQYKELRAISADASGVPAWGASVLTSQQSASLGAGTSPTTPPETPVYRTTWKMDNVSGRDISLRLAATATASAQKKLFRLEVDAVDGNIAQVSDY